MSRAQPTTGLSKWEPGCYRTLKTEVNLRVCRLGGCLTKGSGGKKAPKSDQAAQTPSGPTLIALLTWAKCQASGSQPLRSRTDSRPPNLLIRAINQRGSIWLSGPWIFHQADSSGGTLSPGAQQSQEGFLQLIGNS